MKISKYTSRGAHRSEVCHAPVTLLHLKFVHTGRGALRAAPRGTEPELEQKTVATRRGGGPRRPLAVVVNVFPVAGPRLGLEPEVAQFGGVVGVQHRSVGAVRSAQRAVRRVERLIAAGEQVELGVAQAWVAVGVCGSVLVA